METTVHILDGLSHPKTLCGLKAAELIGNPSIRPCQTCERVRRTARRQLMNDRRRIRVIAAGEAS